MIVPPELFPILNKSSSSKYKNEIDREKVDIYQLGMVAL